MARFSSVLALALMAPAVAFMPQAPICRRDVSMSAEGRTSAMWQKPLTLLPALLVGMSGMGALAPQPALADGAVSYATIKRAGGLYGPRVIALKSAVEKGDFAAIKAEEGAIRLFNSGAFANNRVLQKEVLKTYGEVAKAVQAQDAGALKSAWAKYFTTAGLDKTNPFTKDDVGQAYSTDFTFTHNNKNFDPRI